MGNISRKSFLGLFTLGGASVAQASAPDQAKSATPPKRQTDLQALPAQHIQPAVATTARPRSTR